MILPVMLGVQTVWAVFVAATTGLLAPWLPIVIAVTGLLAAAGLALNAAGRLSSVPVPAVAGLAGISLLLGPGLWSGSVLVPAYAGPRADNGFGGPPADTAAARNNFAGTNEFARRNAPGGPGTAEQGGPAEGGMNGAVGPAASQARGGFGPPVEDSGTLDSADQSLLRFTQASVKTGEPVFATDSWNTASRFIIGAGADVLPFGGFSGSAPSLSVDRFKSMVMSGQLKYVLLSEPLDASGAQSPQGFMRAASYPDAGVIREWMSQHFQLVPSAQAGMQATSGSTYLYQYKA